MSTVTLSDAFGERPIHVALACASLGWPVIPLAPRTGTPALAGYPELASTDPDVIEEWWVGRFCGCDVGLLTGRRAGFWALDVDDKNGKNGAATLAALETEHGPLPRTWRLKTPSGAGYQLWFEYPPDREVRADSRGLLLGPGLDVRGWHSMVRAPYARRGKYRILDNWAPVRAPAWLEDRVERREDTRLRPDSDDAWAPIDIGDWIARAGDVLAGQEDYLWRGICSLRARYAGRDQAIAVAWDATSRFVNTKPSEPWTYEHVVKKVDYVWRRYPAGPRVDPVHAELLKGVVL